MGLHTLLRHLGSDSSIGSAELSETSSTAAGAPADTQDIRVYRVRYALVSPCRTGVRREISNSRASPSFQG